MTTFGKFIKEQRELKSWTQTEFGAKLGINSSAISRIENGNKVLSSAKLELISSLFCIELIKVKELYYADKIALEIYNSGCPESVLVVAEESIRYLKQKNQKQAEIKF